MDEENKCEVSHARGWTEEIIDIYCLNFNKPNTRKIARTLWAALPLWLQDNLI